MSNKNKKLNLDKETLYKLYIEDKMTSKEIGELFDCTSKSIRNYLNYYNIPIRQNGEAVKLERSKWSDEKERARSLKFMTTWANKSEEERNEIIKKCTRNANSPEAIEKARKTKLANDTYIKSKSEDEFYDKLITLFGKDDVVRQYRDDKVYPYSCDFYIKSKDLFIEYQGHHTHGYEPFDSSNKEHIEYLNKMESKGFNMNTWTNRDVRKIECAINNDLKLLLIYPKHNSYLIKNGKIET